MLQTTYEYSVVNYYGIWKTENEYKIEGKKEYNIVQV